MDLPQHPGDVLSQPTRARLFKELGELARPAGTEEIARGLGLHPNGVRLHLERMFDAGLVQRERPRERVGRPRDMWSIAPGARPGGEAPHAYADLGRWLAQVVSAGRTTQRAVEATGREIGRDLAPADGSGPADAQLRSALASLGFAPAQEDGDSGTLTYRLGNCPYRDVARENQHIVCTLHRGVTRGLLDAIAPQAELAGFVPREPDTAGCLIQVQGHMADDSASESPA